MTFAELRKQIEERVATIQRNVEKYPNPNINDRDVVPDNLFDCGKREGELNSLQTLLKSWPEEKKMWKTEKKKTNG